jgi:hypothetical protein
LTAGCLLVVGQQQHLYIWKHNQVKDSCCCHAQRDTQWLPSLSQTLTREMLSAKIKKSGHSPPSKGKVVVVTGDTSKKRK